MMSILLIAYFVFVIIVAVFGAVGLFHARRYHYPHDRTGLATTLYLATFTTIVIISLIMIAGTDWSG